VLGPDDVENFVEKPAPVTATKWGLLKKKNTERNLGHFEAKSTEGPSISNQIKTSRSTDWDQVLTMKRILRKTRHPPECGCQRVQVAMNRRLL
jgi:hypothetical protein